MRWLGGQLRLMATIVKHDRQDGAVVSERRGGLVWRLA